MSYASATQLYYHIPASRLPSAIVSSAMVEHHLEVASRVADSYFRGLYAVPIAAPTSDIVGAVCSLAGCSLLRAVGHDPSDPADADVMAACVEAREWLAMVRDGEVDLDVPAATSGVRVPTVTSDTIRGW